MTFIAALLTAIWLVFTGGAPASANHGPVQAGDLVLVKWACLDREVTFSQYLHLYRQNGDSVEHLEAIRAGECAHLRMRHTGPAWVYVRVTEVLHVGNDWEGDTMVVVKLATNPATYTIFWPDLMRVKHGGGDRGQGA